MANKGTQVAIDTALLNLREFNNRQLMIALSEALERIARLEERLENNEKPQTDNTPCTKSA